MGDANIIISKSPYRISFFGGGSDFPVYYKKYGGAVLSTTIDKFCWIMVRWLPPFFEHKYRVVWSRNELPNTIEDIVHPSVRECLRFMDISDGVEVTHMGDLPARSGIGSSSSFTVGLLYALYALKGKMVSKEQLAKDAVYVEQEMIKEIVGSQDQTASAYGGLNRIDFGEDISVTPLVLKGYRYSELESHLMLFFTGLSRTASEVLGEQIQLIPERLQELEVMKGMVDEGIDILTDEQTSLHKFGELLDKAWMYKRKLSSQISNSRIDEIYEKARNLGVIGGKLCGAGFSGFFLMFAEPSKQQQIIEGLQLLSVPFHFERMGSQIIYYSP